MSRNDDDRFTAPPPDRPVLEVTDLLRFSMCFPRRNTTVMLVSGDIDLYTAPCFRAQLCRVFGAGPTMVVLDLSPVTFLAAVGLRVLVDAQAQAEKTRRRMILVAEARCVVRALEVTGLAPSFRRVRTLDAALSDRAVGYEETA
ncbi:anti-anti-sigma factor [Nocardia tenerifensis]|uniref:Anti-sigma factor antagonist n=1 Tax=Nocardia tenerifensis TaxID=228006 RepID=A0A318K703_9NOCA|nr:STAS domain-containing protein [Nocardia tenerifensis]PXX69118.1 anti-anti-sigma factor [Nocardia tenerifensis]